MDRPHLACDVEVELTALRAANARLRAELEIAAAAAVACIETIDALKSRVEQLEQRLAN